MTKVDILLPYWGDFKLLKLAVESVMAQTEPDWRLLVFDDCYPSDGPAKYFASLTDSRIVYKRHRKNIGVTANFNVAVNAAQAPYCVLMGCDDVMLPVYLETALAHIDDADFYQPGVAVIDETGKTYLPISDRIKHWLQPNKAGRYAGEKLAVSLCYGNWLYFPSIMWRSAIIKKYGFNADYSVAQDVFLELNIIKDGGKLFFDKTQTFKYRRFAHSVSSLEKSTGKRFREENAVYSHFSHEFKIMGWRRAARASQIRLTSRLHQLIS